MSQPNAVGFSTVTTTGVTVTTAGTAYKCPATTMANRLRVRIQNTNATANIFIGGSNVSNTGSTVGIKIGAGDQDEFDFCDGMYLTADANAATATVMEMA